PNKHAGISPCRRVNERRVAVPVRRCDRDIGFGERAFRGLGGRSACHGRQSGSQRRSTEFTAGYGRLLSCLVRLHIFTHICLRLSREPPSLPSPPLRGGGGGGGGRPRANN